MAALLVACAGTPPKAVAPPVETVVAPTPPTPMAPPAPPKAVVVELPPPPRVPPKLGLALGGGAARGFAHIGVIQVLEEAGLRPDFVAGTSAGSVVAALYASGKTGAQLQQIGESMEEAAISDWTLPVFNSGILTDPKAGATFNYEVASPEVLARAQNIEKFFIERGVSLAQAALQYPMRHPAISAILVGCRNGDEVQKNVELYNRGISEDIWNDFDNFLLEINPR
jgi:predicted acylesterase/phospholipase RssA